MNTKSVAVTVKQKPTLSVTTTPAGCASGGGGAANLTVSGVSGTLSYAWSNGANTQDLSNVNAGTYTVTVNLTGGCSNSTMASIAGGSCAAPTTYFTQNVSNSGATVRWGKVSCAVKYRLRYKPSTASSWITVLTNDTFVNLSGLSQNLMYQYQVLSYCNPTLTDASPYGVQQSFVTSGGCSAPGGLSTTQITSTSAKLNWTAVPGAWGYKVRIRRSNNSSAWTEFTVQTNSYSVTGLLNATSYKWQVMTLCNAGGTSASSYGSLIYFNTFTYGRFEESEEQPAPSEELTTNMMVYPNPIESFANIAIEQNFESEATLELYSMTGYLIRQEVVVIGVGTTSVGWDAGDLPAGTYIVSLRQQTGVTTSRIVKQ